SEARMLRWAVISDTHILFTAATTKTKTSREMPIALQLLDVLKRWKVETNPRPTDFIVPGEVVGRPMSRQAFDKQLRATCERLGLELLKRYQVVHGYLSRQHTHFPGMNRVFKWADFPTNPIFIPTQQPSGRNGYGALVGLLEGGGIPPQLGLSPQRKQ
ncbi:tyrosine-type recombinase/integrase, partial [Parasynechococcus sp.]|uniref:tyrosine-type recombinase/integrase n=1 Tax=Parasynechococcus sp. TaxID=3101203 RepID=UPI0037046A06